MRWRDRIAPANWLFFLAPEVIKVERPKTGDEFREYSPTTFAAANSGKRSITLDLKSIEGRNILDELIKTADILVENLRPGSGAGLGLDWERLKGLNSRLIFCSITGFGQTGEFRDMPAIRMVCPGDDRHQHHVRRRGR